MAGERILVVDDEPDARELVCTLLSGRGGYQVRAATGGEEALKALADAPADLVLTDLRMPGMDGFALLKAMHQRFPGTAALVFSGAEGDEQVVRSFQGGALDFLRKPFKAQDLLEAVRGALGRRGEALTLDVHYEKDGWLELTAESALETVARFRSFTARLAESRLPREELEALRFALDELGRNAVEWGNRGQPGRRIRCACCLLEDRLMVKIEDQGEGFDPGTLPDPSADPGGFQRRREEQGKRPGGLGIHLVRGLMDEVIYSQKGNVVLMTKRLAARPA